jgi:hypothetical protein
MTGRQKIKEGENIRLRIETDDLLQYPLRAGVAVEEVVNDRDFSWA